MAKFLLDLENSWHDRLRLRAAEETVKRGYRVTMNRIVSEAVAALLDVPPPSAPKVETAEEREEREARETVERCTPEHLRGLKRGVTFE